MADVSVSDVKVTFCGVRYTLRANWEAMVAIEQALQVPYALVFARMGGGVPRLSDVTEAFAAMALPHGAHTAEAIRSTMPFDAGASLIEAAKHVSAAIKAAQPKTAETDEAEAGAAVADPQ